MKRTEGVTLDQTHVSELEQMVASINNLAQQESPPPVLTNRKLCKKCSFEELCFG
ncbi:CRISPR-associated protein Cas4 [Ravibacter arvi]|uniref:CRISPR-associated protein Cas4 n=1 Tax=Ravibacter arvi TaxID=2051041 RepID=UPI0031F1913A